MTSTDWRKLGEEHFKAAEKEDGLQQANFEALRAIYCEVRHQGEGENFKILRGAAVALDEAAKNLASGARRLGG